MENFPDLGSHVRWGKWADCGWPPIKLLGWVLGKIDGCGKWFVVLAGRCPGVYQLSLWKQILNPPVLDGIQVERLQYCPQGKAGMVIKYNPEKTPALSCAVNVNFCGKDWCQSACGFQKRNNIIDAADSIRWDAKGSVYVARDVKNPWFALWGSSLPVSSHAVNAVTPMETMGLGKSASTTHLLEIKPNEHAVALSELTYPAHRFPWASPHWQRDYWRERDDPKGQTLDFLTSVPHNGPLSIPAKWSLPHQ